MAIFGQGILPQYSDKDPQNGASNADEIIVIFNQYLALPLK